MKTSLPIDPYLPQILKSLESSPSFILKASPGSGKTTRVPPALLNSPFTKDKEILVLEPRRLAAKYSAKRVAEELGERLGEKVGYHFRLERVAGASTRLLFLTEGMLMRRLMGDPQLNKVAAVVLDEFHERSLHSDIALATLKKLQDTQRPDLRILVMSATLDTEKIQSYLKDCVSLEVEAPRFPVDVKYLPSPSEKPVERLISETVKEIEGQSPDGDILIFLPGMADIRRTEEKLHEGDRSRLIQILHGELSREDQDQVFQRAPKRKIILSTNIAETSLTIEGVRYVIDTGLHRQAQFSFWSGIPSLRTKAISKASSIQRAGRAGRTAPGVCYRLYTKHDFDTKEGFEKPEILRSDLAQTVLELKFLGFSSPDEFPWLEKPPVGALEAGRDLLYRLGATDSGEWSASLTNIGRKMVEIPAHPRISRILLSAHDCGVLPWASLLSATISEGWLESTDALEDISRPSEGVLRVARQLISATSRNESLIERKMSREERLAVSKAVLSGFPDRVAQKKQTIRSRTGEWELFLSQGGIVKATDSAFVSSHEYFIPLDLREQKALGQKTSQLRAQSLVGLEPEWLFDVTPSPLKEEDRVTWEAEKKQMKIFSAILYDGLVLSEGEKKFSPSPLALKTLLKEGLQCDDFPPKPDTVFASLSRVTGNEDLNHWWERLKFLTEKTPADQVPGWKDIWPAWEEALSQHFSISSLKAMDWLALARSSLPATLAGKFESWVPESIRLPSGRRAKVHYPSDRPPWVESRLQDFFGMKRGPSLLDGRIPLTLHLLAPNQRAVQVTSDLEGFWAREYPRLRKELGRRYPRHAWPEDPLKPLPPRHVSK
jgi:ATP-dependent helicase HrpB